MDCLKILNDALDELSKPQKPQPLFYFVTIPEYDLYLEREWIVKDGYKFGDKTYDLLQQLYGIKVHFATLRPKLFPVQTRKSRNKET